MKLFDAHAAYKAEREHARTIEALLANALILLGMECSRRENNGEDVAHIRAFIKKASQ